MWIRIQSGEYINLDVYYGIGCVKDERAGSDHTDYLVVAFAEPENSPMRGRIIIADGDLKYCKRTFDRLCDHLNAVDVDA